MRIDLYNDGSYDVDWGIDEKGVEAYEESGGGISYRPAPKSEVSVGRTAKDAERIPFLWKTHKGKVYEVQDMATPHLIHAINMIWRNVFKLKNDHPEIMDEWASLYVDTAAREIIEELQRRVEDA
jgi:hypothetical protein